MRFDDDFPWSFLSVIFDGDLSRFRNNSMDDFMRFHDESQTWKKPSVEWRHPTVQQSQQHLRMWETEWAINRPVIWGLFIATIWWWLGFTKHWWLISPHPIDTIFLSFGQMLRLSIEVDLLMAEFHGICWSFVIGFSPIFPGFSCFFPGFSLPKRQQFAAAALRS